jgi:HipA-like protein
MTYLLDVYYRKQKAGLLSQEDGGALSFAYDPGYLEGSTSSGIAFSMPLQEAGYGDRIVRPFFSGLLPDGGATAPFGRARDFLRQCLWLSGGHRRGMRGGVIALSRR